MSATGLISSALADSGGGDVDILDFALTLEYLENEFYVQAAKQAKGLSDYESDLTKKLRDNESDHVGALAATIKKLAARRRRSRRWTSAARSPAGSRTSRRPTRSRTPASAPTTAPPPRSTPPRCWPRPAASCRSRRATRRSRLIRDVAPAPRAFDKASEMDAVLTAVKPFIKG